MLLPLSSHIQCTVGSASMCTPLCTRQENITILFNKLITMMKKVLVILIVALLSINASAQVEKSNQKVLTCGVKWLGTKDYKIKLDYGFEEREVPKDENGNEITFNNRISVINYMTLQGWVFQGISKELEPGTEVMRFQKVVSDEEAKEFLKKIRYAKKDKK